MIPSLIKYIVLMRPKQWLKNVLLLFPPFFAGSILEPRVLASIVPSLLSFSLASSCCYIINDIHDREFDKHHALKNKRPIARGDISVTIALLFAAFLYLASMLISASLSYRFEGYLIVYLFLSVLYTFLFKKIVLIDIFIISSGFLIRVLAGGEAFHISISSWLFLTVFVVSLLLASGKRMAEQVALGDDAYRQRAILMHYPPSFLEGILWFSSAVILVTYALYTIERHDHLFYTVPVVAFGLLRYIYIVMQGKGDPTEVLLQDKQIMITGILWLSMISVLIYK